MNMNMELIPITHLALDLPEPVFGWEKTFAERGVEIVLDDLGRPSVPRQVLGALLQERREREARVLSDAESRRSKLVDRKVPAGVPAIDDMSAFESMAAGPGYESLRDEFGLPKPNFLDEELAAGRRENAERRRAVARMKDDLGKAKQ